MLNARVLLAILLPAVSVLAQSDPASLSRAAANDQSPPTFRSETNLVLVRFQLAPKKEGSNNLTPEDIELREDGVAQKIEVFQGGERYPQTIPVEINLLFDNVSHGEPVKPVWMNSWKIDMGAIDSRGIASISVWGLGQGLIRLTPPTRDPAMLSRAMDRVWDIWSAPYRSEARMLSVIAAVAGTAAQGRTNVVRMITVVTRGCNVEQDDDTARAVGELGTPIFPLLVRDIEAQTPDFFSRSATMAVARCEIRAS